jgi:hypothetical protein
VCGHRRVRGCGCMILGAGCCGHDASMVCVMRVGTFVTVVKDFVADTLEDSDDVPWT